MTGLNSQPRLGRVIWTVLVSVYSLIFFCNLFRDALGDSGLIQCIFSAVFVVWLGIEYYFGSPFFQSGLFGHSTLWRGLFACFVYPYIGYAAADFIWWHWTQVPVPRVISGSMGLFVFVTGTGLRLFTLFETIRILQPGQPVPDSSQITRPVISGKRLVRLRLQQLCRHPRYLATLIQLLGIALVFRSWGALVLSLLIGFPLILIQARYEDALLRERLGADFEAYRQRIPLLLPRRR